MSVSVNSENLNPSGPEQMPQPFVFTDSAAKKLKVSLRRKKILILNSEFLCREGVVLVFSMVLPLMKL